MVIETTRELAGSGVPLLEALVLALRPPAHLVRADGTPLGRVGDADPMAPRNWYRE